MGSLATALTLLQRGHRGVDGGRLCLCSGLWKGVQGVPTLTWAEGLRVQDLKRRAWGLGLRAQGLKLRALGLGFRVQGSGFEAQGFGLRL